MLIKEATNITGSLGKPSKMPGTSYGISAEKCITGSKLANIPGSTCHGCYALGANYQYPSVAQAHQKRLEGIAHPLWTQAMVRMLRNKHQLDKVNARNPVKITRHHRWHDSGDLQSEEHLQKICDVARATPELLHWLPTREIGILSRFVKANPDAIPDNLTVRVSATMVDGNATKAWPLTSTVHKNKSAQGHDCPAIHRVGPDKGKCADCRACWSRDVANVSYHQH